MAVATSGKTLLPKVYKVVNHPLMIDKTNKNSTQVVHSYPN